MGWKKLLPVNLLVITGFLLLVWLFSPNSNVRKSAFAQSACYDLNKFTTGSGNVYLDQNRDGSVAGETCAGTGSSTNNVRINVNNLCPDFPDDYNAYPNNCAYSLTTYKVTLDPGYTWTCTPPAGWVCGNTVNTSWATSPWNIHWWARPNLSCTVSGPTNVCPNTSVSYTLRCAGGNPNGYYRSRPSGSWQSLPDPVSFPAGSYDLIVQSSAVGGVSCSGNPDCWFNGGGGLCAGYFDCGPNDHFTIFSNTTYCPTPTPPSCNSSCTSNSECSGAPNGCTICGTGTGRSCLAANTCYCDLGTVLSDACTSPNIATCDGSVQLLSCACRAPAAPTPTRTRTPTPAPPTATRTPTGIPTPQQAQIIKLTNPGFETDADGKIGPDFWTSDSRFTRDSAVKRSGSYSGRHKATNSGDTSYLIYQSVSGIQAGKGYKFSGYVKIPATSDSFSFKLQVKWLNSSAGIISTKTIKTYSGQTSGWNLFDSGNITAPTGATSAQARMSVTGLNATVYVDDFSFSAY